MTGRIEGASAGYAGVGLDEEFGEVGAGRLADGGAAGVTADLADVLGADTADLSALATGATSIATSARTPPSAAHGVAAALVADGWPGLDTFLESHPEALRELLTTNRDAMEGSIEAALLAERGPSLVPFFGSVRAAWQADGVMDRVAERFEAVAREAVRREATTGIDRMLEVIEGASPEALAADLLAAAPGTPEASIAALAREHGGSLEPWRLAEYLDAAADELRELRGVLAGGTWSPEEFPGSTRRAMAAMGLERAAHGSVAEGAAERDRPDGTTVVAFAEVGADAVLHATEAFHLFHAGAAVAGGASAGLAIGAVAFGVVLHHAIEENRAERLELARAFGL